MKNFIFLLIGALIVGLVCFAVMYWVFNINRQESFSTSMIVVITGIIVEYIRPYLERKKEKKSH